MERKQNVGFRHSGFRQLSVKQLLLGWLLLCWTGLVSAADLESQRIEAYIASLEQVRLLGDELEAEGKQAFLAQQVMPQAGQSFSPHRQGVELLQQREPDYYERLGRIALQRGFTSAESWALTGDRIVLAYGALKASAESPEMLGMINGLGAPEQALMLQALPEAQRRQVQQAMEVAKALAQVPQADRQAVRPYIGQLDRLFSEQ